MRLKKAHPASDKAEGIDKIRRQLMVMFEQSVGYEFRVKGSVAGVELTDYVKGVDWKNNHVCGETYGNFHVDFLELTGKKKG